MSQWNTVPTTQWYYRPTLLIMVSLILIFTGWAYVSKIDEHVRGTGRVIPAGKARTIQHLEGGIVNKILAEEGDQVAAGATLFTIQNKRAESSRNEIEIDLTTQEIKKHRLLTELEDVDEITFDKALTESYASVIESETQQFRARRNEFLEKLSGIREQIRQKELRLADLNAQVTNLNAELDVAQEQFEIKERLYEAGATSRSQYLEAQSRVRNFTTRIGQVKKEIPVVVAEFSELQKRLSETREKQNADVTEDLTDVNVEIKKLQERLNALTDEVNRTEIKSPINGVVNKIFMNTRGGVMQPGQPLAEIIPVDELLIIEGQISTDDRGKIWPGLPVTAKITAYDYTIYGGLKGELTYISADSFIDKKGQEFYQIRVELKSDKLKDDQPIFPGMTADLNVIAGQTTILKAILKPFISIRENALKEL